MRGSGNRYPRRKGCLHISPGSLRQHVPAQVHGSRRTTRFDPTQRYGLREALPDLLPQRFVRGAARLRRGPHPDPAQAHGRARCQRVRVHHLGYGFRRDSRKDQRGPIRTWRQRCHGYQRRRGRCRLLGPHAGCLRPGQQRYRRGYRQRLGSFFGHGLRLCYDLPGGTRLGKIQARYHLRFKLLRVVAYHRSLPV